MLPPEERETIIRTTDAEEVWHIWVDKSSVRCRQLLKKLTPVREDKGGCYFEVPLSWVSIRAPKKMNLTPEQRANLGKRLRKSPAVEQN